MKGVKVNYKKLKSIVIGVAVLLIVAAIIATCVTLLIIKL